MTGSALLHGTGWVHAVLPWWIGSSCVVLGGVVGSRFADTSDLVSASGPAKADSSYVPAKRSAKACFHGRFQLDLADPRLRARDRHPGGEMQH